MILAGRKSPDIVIDLHDQRICFLQLPTSYVAAENLYSGIHNHRPQMGGNAMLHID